MAETKKTLIGNIKGPQGDTGDKGDKGDTGATGQRGSGWTQGLAITGTSTDGTVFPESGIEDALANDNYLNTYTGNTYRCILGGDASTAEWVYTGNLKGPAGEVVVDAELDSESENPVQNKVIAESLSKKQNLLAKGHAEGVSSNLNLIVETGVYLIGDTTIFTNLPEDLQAQGYCELVVFNSGVYVVQEIFSPFDTKGNIYYRFRTEQEDGWKSWKNFGEIYDGYDETRKGFAADATQLNKEVEGSYAAGVAEEISLINTDLLKRTNTRVANDATTLSNIKDTGIYAVSNASDMPNGNNAAVMEVINFSYPNGNYCIQRVTYIEDINTIYQRRIHQESGVGEWVKFSSNAIFSAAIPWLYNYFTAKQPLFLISENSQDTMYCNGRGCRRNSSAKALLFKRGGSLKGISLTSGYGIISYSDEDAGCTALTDYGAISILQKRTPKGNVVSIGSMVSAWVSSSGTEDFPVIATINEGTHELVSRALYSGDQDSYFFILSMADLYLF